MTEWFAFLENCPARVNPGQMPRDGEQFAGLVSGTAPGILVVDLIGAALPAGAGSVQVEIVHPEGLYRFAGGIDPAGSPQQKLYIRVPPREHWECIERRKHRRIPVSLPAWLAVDHAQHWQATVTNVSVGGISLTTVAPLSIGLSVQVGFGLGNRLPLGPLEGRVVRLVPPTGDLQGAGVMFLNLPPQAERQLELFVSRNGGHPQGRMEIYG